MANQIQKADQQTNQITSATWRTALARLPVREDTPQDEVLRLGTPQVSALNAGTGSTENGVQVFEVLVQTLVKYFNTGWGKGQREVAEILHSKYYWLHMAEIRQFSMKAKAGDFECKEWFKNSATDEMEEWDGKIYGEFKPGNLLKWMERYANESLITRGAIQLNNKPLPPLTDEERAKLVKTETVNAAIADMMERYGVKDDAQTKAEKEEIYRQEKIKQRQRDVMRDQQNEQP